MTEESERRMFWYSVLATICLVLGVSAMLLGVVEAFTR